MKRKEKEIADRAAVEAVILSARVCRLGMACDNRPCVVPLCFGYENNTLYLHSARKGERSTSSGTTMLSALSLIRTIR